MRVPKAAHPINPSKIGAVKHAHTGGRLDLAP
jgi:hypothetical protein